MKEKVSSIIMASILLASCSSQNMKSTYQYPETKKTVHTDEYFGTKVEDPYRWLEDDRAEDTKDWVQREVGFTKNYLPKFLFVKKYVLS
jgi:prolyl oligopeptidase